jgi:hypothetical protein
MMPAAVIDETVEQVVARLWHAGDIEAVQAIENMNDLERHTLARHELLTEARTR